MKKRKRDVPLQFWVSRAEARIITGNMDRNGMSNLSEYLRVLSLSNAVVSFSVKMPNVVQVSEANLTPGVVAEERSRKRAAGQ